MFSVLSRADLLGPLTAVSSGCYWCPSVSVAPRDVGGPSGSLRGPPIVISLDAPRLSGCKRKSSLAPVSVSSALDVSRPSWSKSTATYSSSLACFSNLQWDEFRDLISLPLFTFHGDHTAFHAYYWEGSGVKCWGKNICFALLQKNLVSNHYKDFPGVPPLVRLLFHLLLFSRVSLSDWVVWNFSCGYDPFR